MGFDPVSMGAMAIGGLAGSMMGGGRRSSGPSYHAPPPAPIIIQQADVEDIEPTAVPNAPVSIDETAARQKARARIARSSMSAGNRDIQLTQPSFVRRQDEMTPVQRTTLLGS